jgi:alkanesulfonate monooxygenase SsuD/methylene tetrahydromethanopterin reductase-like flavin-dependent oxidoreductase (luciferase family)
MEIAERAEAAGWDGLFLWDHILRPPTEPQEIADVWIALAAIATASTTLRIGPMVTPTARRRPQKLVREAITLDRLSAGRVTLGLGLGVDTSGELSRFGEMTDAAERGNALDEAATLIAGLLSGERVQHRGTYFMADDVQFLPPPIQNPRIPMWFAARGESRRPVRRAARYDGLFAIEVDTDGLRRMIDVVDEERGDHEGFDIAVVAREDTDLPEWEEIGATWAMWSFRPGAPMDDIWQRVDDGPIRSANSNQKSNSDT